MAGLHFDITGDNSNFLRKLEEARNGVATTSKKIEESGMSIEQLYGRMTSAAAGFGVALSAKEIVSNVVRVRGEFQQLEVAFNTMLGSEEKASSLMSQLVNTAAKTPFDLQGVANGAKQMLAYGTAAEDVNDTLVRLGDIAAGLSIPLNDLVWLYGTTMTQGRLFTQDLRQFQGRGIPLADELAKQFGVAKDKVGELVTAGKVGFPEVQKAIEAMTNDGGKFGGLMEAQSKTITGQISNIEDAIDTMYNNIGKSSEGFINEALSGVSYLVENYEEIGRIVLELVGTYGAYKAVLITITALQRVNSAVVAQAAVEQQFAALAGHKLSDAQALAAAKTKLLTIAQQGLVKSLKAAGAALVANPYIIAAAAIAGMSLAIYKVVTAETAMEKANNRLNDAIKESNKAALSEQRELAKLKGELSATTKGTKEYNRIRDVIVSKYGQYDKNLKDEIDKVGLLDETYQNLTKSIQRSFDARQYEKFKQEQSTALDDVMSDNLNEMYDKLVGKWGDELGAKHYTEIKNALMVGEEIPSHLNNVVSNMYGIWAQSLHGYINNIREAQKATEEADKKARVKFGIEDGSGNSEDEGKKNGTQKELSSISEEIKAVTEKIVTLKQELSDLRSGKTTAEAGKTVQDTIEEKTKELKAAEDALSTLTGKDKASDKKLEDEQKKQLEKQKAIYKELLDLRLQNQQSEINQMKDGSEKKIAQINLDYDKEITAILAKEQEWKEAQGGKLTQEQVVEIRMAKVNAGAKLGNATSDITHEQIEAEERAMNEYLKEYGSYLEKRQAITELYNEKIAKATTEGERLSLAEGMKKELADVDNEAQKSTSIITRLFDDMSKKNITSIRAIADEAEKFLSFLERGEYSSNNSFGITKEQFDVLRKSPDQLKAIKDEIANVRREADQMETSFNKVSNGLKKVFASENDTKKLKEGLAEIEEGMNEIMQAGQFLSDTFSKIGDSFGGVFDGIAEGFSVAMDTVSSAMNGAKAGSMFGPIGASAGAAIGVVTSLAGAIAKIHDAKNEKRIERLQDQIDTLDKSYDKLEKSIEKAYSKDASKLIEQNNKLLEQQKLLIQQQIREEQDKKKTDDNRIKEWQNQIDEINEAIADNKEKAVDAIFGEDLKSAIDNFANAQAEAWASGEDRAESAKDTVKKMMRQMVTESIKAATESSGAMEKIRQKLKEFYADNVLSGWEQDYIYNMAEELQRELDRQFGWADSLMKDETEEDVDDTSDNSLKGAYAKASQESINLLAGQTGAVRVLLEDIRGSMQPIREQMRLIYDMQSRGWEDVKAIRELSDKVEKNTEQIADNTKEIKSVADKIDQNTRNTVDALEGTINVKVKM